MPRIAMMKSIVFSILGSVLLFARCNSSIDVDLLSDEESVPISIAVGEDRISTRAPVTIYNPDSVSKYGIYGVPEGSTSGLFPWTASLPLLNTAPASLTGTQIGFSPKVYYPDGGKRLMFYGYYPRTTMASGNNNITAPGSGTAPVFNFTLTGQEDIMYATSTPFGSNTAGVPSLTFGHKLTQIVLDLSLLGVLKSATLKGIKSKGSMNLGTGVVSYSTTTIDIPLTMQSGVLNSLTVPVMVPADMDKYRVEVVLLILPITYYIRPTSGNFLPGKIYTIKLPLL